jgi:hypothetical protein
MATFVRSDGDHTVRVVRWFRNSSIAEVGQGRLLIRTDEILSVCETQVNAGAIGGYVKLNTGNLEKFLLWVTFGFDVRDYAKLIMSFPFHLISPGGD